MSGLEPGRNHRGEAAYQGSDDRGEAGYQSGDDDAQRADEHNENGGHGGHTSPALPESRAPQSRGVAELLSRARRV